MGRLIGGDKLIEKYGDYYVEEGPEEGFIGTLKALVDTVPTANPVSNDGWALCSERMPEEKDSMFAKNYGTDRWRNGMFRKRSEYVDVTVVRSDGEREVAVAKTLDGKWNIEQGYYLHPVKVIAWKPRVKPYMGDE